MSNKIRTVLLGAAVLASPAAFAGTSANVGVTSDYMFRGITQTAGPAVQGGIDYENDSGFYVGTWASNIGFGGAAGGTEQDVYFGFAFDAGPIGIDLGAVYYWYPEEDEVDQELSTLEFAVGLSWDIVSLSVAIGPETNFFIGDGDGEGAMYINLGVSPEIAEGLTLGFSIGQYSGDEIERVLGPGEDSYIDYSISLTKELKDGFSASFAYIASDLSTDNIGFDDGPKVVLTAGKSFDL